MRHKIFGIIGAGLLHRGNTASANNTTVTTIGPAITDSLGNKWTIIGSLGAASGQMAVNGVGVTATAYVSELAYVGGVVYVYAYAAWYPVLRPSGASTTVGAGTTTSPLPPPVSPNDTVVSTVGPAIIDSNENAWTITSGAQVALNGSATGATSYTSNVIAIAYVSGTMWQENSSNNWYSFTSTGAFGTGPTTSPLPNDITGITLSGASFTGGAASGTVVGTISARMSSGSFTGSFSLTGTNAASFKIVGSNLETNGVIAAGSYSLNIVATQSGAPSSPFTQAETITGSVAITTISGITLGASTFTGGAASGTVVGAISVQTSSGSFTGSLSLSGTNASSFQIVGSNLETNGVIAAGSYSLNVVATQAGATGSPFTQAETLTGTAAFSTTIPTYATPPSTGTTYYVNASTGSDSNNGTTISTPWATLYHAGVSVAGGSTVLVYNGTYTSTGTVLYISGLNGSATSWTVFKAAPGQAPVIQGNNAGEGVYITSSSYICVQGFTVTGMNASLTLSGAESNHTATQYNVAGILVGGGSSGVNSHHISILNNTVSEFPQDGISCYFCDYVTIQGNVSFNNAFYSYNQCSGISLWQLHNHDTVAGYHNNVSGNICYGNIDKVGASGTTTTGVTDGEGIIIDDNHNDQSDSVPYTSRTLLSNNICYTNGSEGISVGASDYCDIIFNTTYHNATNAANMTGGVGGVYEISTWTASNCNVYNNIMSATSSTPYIYTGGATTTYSHNLAYGGTGTCPGSGNVTTNPNFASTTTFVLNSGSPAIGVASSTFTVAADIYGNVRPGPNGYSLGAVEYL